MSDRPVLWAQLYQKELIKVETKITTLQNRSNITDKLNLVGLSLLSVLVMMIISHFSTEAFIFDDNRNQWTPVINRAYDIFFSTGHMPNYSFFLAKGLEIADQGFYSLNNPIMLFSYILYRFVFLRSWGSAITIYIYMMFLLGNITVYLLGRKMGLNPARSAVVVTMYMSCSAFVLFGYWYYIFNNYFLFLLFIYMMIRFKDEKLRFCACGIVFAFSLTLGNIQYTVYQYMMYCIIMLTITIFSNRKRFWEMIANCVTGIVLSVPSLVLLLQSSGRSETYTEDTAGFLSVTLNPLDYLVFSVLPSKLIQNVFRLQINVMASQTDVMFHNSAWLMYIGGLGICIAILVVLVLKQLIQKSRKKETTDWKQLFSLTESKAFYIGTGIAVWFFVSLAVGGCVGKLLSFVPVINQFRYAFKSCFVFTPLLVIPAICLLKRIEKKYFIRILCTVCIICSVIGVGSNYFCYEYLYEKFALDIQDRYENEVSQTGKTLEEHHIDINNYRVCTFINDNGDTVNNVVHKLTRNVPISANVFSLAAYDQTESELSFRQSDRIYTEYSQVAFLNQESYLDEMPQLAFEDLNEFETQMINNSVKYIIINNGQQETESIEQLFDKCQSLKIKSNTVWMETFRLVEIDGVAPICTDSQNSQTNFRCETDSLQFRTDGKSEKYRLSFTYKDRLSADYISDDGTISQRLAMTSDENGYITIATKNLPKGTVTITYHNGWIIGNTIFSVLSVVLFVGILFVPIIHSKRKQAHRAENTEDERAEQQ